MHKVFSAALLCFCLVWPLAGASSGADRDSPETARKEVHGRLLLLLDRQEQLNRTMAACRKELDEITLGLAQAQAKTKELEREQAGMSQALDKIKGQAVLAAAELKTSQERYEASLRALYLRGPEASTWLLVSSNDLKEALIHLRSFTMLVSSLKARLDVLRQRQRDLAAQKAQVAYRHNELLEIKAAMGEQQRRLIFLHGQHQELLADLKEHQRLLDSNINALREAEARLARTFALIPARQGVLANRGRLSPPVEGQVVGRSGPGRQGVIMEARPGAPVRSPWWGRVVFAGPLAGYGRVAVVDHGQRVHTVLAHLGALSVETGQELKAGQVVGAVDAGGRLYLEVRKATRPENPLLWLRLNP